MIVGMPMSSSMLIIIMVPLMISAGYPEPLLPTLAARFAQRYLS